MCVKWKGLSCRDTTTCSVSVTQTVGGGLPGQLCLQMVRLGEVLLLCKFLNLQEA